MTDQNLKTIEGNLSNIDLEKRVFTLSGKDHVIFVAVSYGERFDYLMRKQKIGYYEKPTVTMTGADTACLEDLSYTERPPDYPRLPRTGGSGKPQYQPRDEHLMVYIAAYKSNAENVRDMLPMTEDIEDIPQAAQLYHSLMDLALTRAISDARALINARREGT